jgi:MFS family permease
MLPLMGGMLVTSVVSGQLISRRGRYKHFPIIGTFIMAVGLFVLSRMTSRTTLAEASLGMLVLGLGLGMVMQVLIIAIQNAVPHRDLGVATSGATLFRLMGGSIGTAIFGAIFTARLAAHLERSLPGGGRSAPVTLSPRTIAELPPEVHAIYVSAFTASLSTVFLAAMCIALVGFALTWFVPERALQRTLREGEH